MRRQRTPAPPPKESPLTAWLNGTRVRVLSGIHKGREGKVQRLYRGNGKPEGYFPHALRVVFDEAIGSSTNSYQRPAKLELLELGTTPAPEVMQVKRPAPRPEAARGPVQRGLFS